LTSAIKQQYVANACARKLSWLAQAYDLVGLEERADETRQFALAQHASDLLLNYEHAMYLLQRNQADQAVRYLMRCTSLRPQNAGVWKGLAEALGQNDELAKTQNAINKAIDLNPNDAVSRLTLAKLLLQDGEPAAAVAAAEVARSLDEELADAYRVISQAKLSLKDYTGALLALENFKMLAPAESDSVEELIAECRRGLIKLEPSK
jgi:predicted Zn-dependent protease